MNFSARIPALTLFSLIYCASSSAGELEKLMDLHLEMRVAASVRATSLIEATHSYLNASSRDEVTENNPHFQEVTKRVRKLHEVGLKLYTAIVTYESNSAQKPKKFPALPAESRMAMAQLIAQTHETLESVLQGLSQYNRMSLGEAEKCFFVDNLVKHKDFQKEKQLTNYLDRSAQWISFMRMEKAVRSLQGNDGAQEDASMSGLSGKDVEQADAYLFGKPGSFKRLVDVKEALSKAY
jgi:hypothetical protein